MLKLLGSVLQDLNPACSLKLLGRAGKLLCDQVMVARMPSDTHSAKLYLTMPFRFENRNKVLFHELALGYLIKYSKNGLGILYNLVLSFSM